MYGIPPASTQGLMEEIFNEAQLLKEDPQLIKRVMEAMRKKLELCFAKMEHMRRGSAGILGI